MIVSENINRFGKAKFKVEVPTPSDIESARRFLVDIHSGNYNVIVNPIFKAFEDLTNEGTTISKNHLPFYFWFFDEDQAQTFADDWNGTLEAL